MTDESTISPFFIGSDKVVADEWMDPNLLMAVAPDYYGPRFDAIKELRDADDGSLHSGSEFRRVASFVNVPLANAITTVLDPEWMKDKKKFYAWLDRNRAYCTYQRKDRATQGAMFQRDFGHLFKEVDNGVFTAPSPEAASPEGNP
jgi:hypothetical protein